VSQVTLARNRSLGGLESGTGSREGNKLEWITLLLVVFLVLAAIIWLWRM
jgi:hypothetical protein